MIKSFYLFAISILLLSASANAQVGIGTVSPNASSVLDVSSTTKGMLVPRMTQTQRNAITTPETGLLVFQTDGTIGFHYYNGTNWVCLGNNSAYVSSPVSGGNTYYGISTGTSSTNQNTGFGYEALKVNGTGSSTNSAFGFRALTANTSGYSNTAIGNSAGNQNQTGYFNTFVGAGAGSGNIHMSQNTFIGSNARVLSGTTIMVNATAIGYNTNVGASNTIQLGNTDVTDVFVANGNGAINATRLVVTVPNVITAAGTTAVNLALGTIFEITLGTSITTLTLTNPKAGTYMIKFVQGAGANTVTFPAAWKWQGGTVPVITTTSGKTDIVTLIYDGTTYFASISQNY